METVKLYINGSEVQAVLGTSILEAARQSDIYIPSLCYHPDLPPSRETKAIDLIYRGNEKIVGDQPQKDFEGCNLCLVEVKGQQNLMSACDTPVAERMKVFTDTPQVLKARQEKLRHILARHPHACLICVQKEGCTRESCSTVVPVAERCCPKFGNCELQKVAEYIGIREDTPRYVPANLPVIRDEPLFVLDYNLCVGCTRCVRACQELRGVKALGFLYKNGEVLVGTVAPNLKDSACRFCGACVEVCPTGALTDKAPIVGDREAILVPCKHACPAGIDVPKYVQLISESRYAEAAAVIREEAPLPSVLAHACTRPCESACRRQEVNKAIAICALKRFVTDQDTRDWKAQIKAASPTGRRIAIIGSGPAGLTAAYYLALQGHSVTIFEAMPEPGGMMRYGIQEYRLPRGVLEKDLRQITGLGVEIKTYRCVNGDFPMGKLRESYDAILLATGLPRSRRLKVEGANLEGVMWGLDLLRDFRLGKEVKVKGKVVVIGGGDVAIDAARTALRLGAEEVRILYRRTRGQMPASSFQVEEAEREGVKIQFLLAPRRILSDDRRVTGIEMVRCTLTLDREGKAHLSYDETETTTMDADTVIFAIGQAPDKSWLRKNSLRVSELGTIEADNSTMQTNIQGVFACGDIVKGPTSIVEALASGKEAAIAIDKYLGGKGSIKVELFQAERANPWMGREENFAYQRRVEMPTLPAEKRRGNFAEVELGLDEKQAIAEARRCLRCDLRLQITPPILPPEKWLRLEAEAVAAVPQVEGVYQLLDENKRTIYIKGTINLRKELTEQLATNPNAKYFMFEEAKMFTMRESELLQQFLKKHGKLPEQNVGIDEGLY